MESKLTYTGRDEKLSDHIVETLETIEHLELCLLRLEFRTSDDYYDEVFFKVNQFKKDLRKRLQEQQLRDSMET